MYESGNFIQGDLEFGVTENVFLHRNASHDILSWIEFGRCA